ncbi:helix-turn-helix domain-containing protein [Pseudoalteromonas viridis]|uniref:Helix-turn-helix transcriptional regulator n=1 Tax=Pseudoalteromonas viridis TaxID=339617 RepID=A0ABX7V349_9GAMM|nr:AraC family transcriptional regulator [Pseudoalteromonas viridis]QTL35324.1 helix-turn-helix transcriptional regulator [Pseudoalteromonas viridis]
MSFQDLILVSSATTCLLFVFLLLSLSHQQRTNSRYLLGYLLLIGAVQLVDIASKPGDTLHLLIGPLALMLGPLFYLYVMSQTPCSKASPWLRVLLFSPAALVMLHWLLFKGQVIATPVFSHNTVLHSIAPMELIYVLAAISQLRQISHVLSQTADGSAPVKLGWLNYLCFLNLIILLLETSYYIARQFDVLPAMNSRALLNTVLQLFLLLVAWRAAHAPQVIFTEQQRQAVRQKYQKSGLTPALSDYYGRKLDTLIRDKQPYLDSELTLSTLAEQVGLNPHNLSQLLNEHLQTNYHDYINHWRVKHATELLKSTSRSVEEIAYDCGFGTRAAFYTAFKKHHQLTLAKWRIQFQRPDSVRQSNSAGPDG